MAAKYVTSTLPYVNDNPHIGHAYELVCADALARHWRLLGHEVFFNSGVDEHGQKVSRKADEKGEARQAYVDHYAGEFKKLEQTLDLSWDNFIRTTDPAHKLAVQEMWRRCDANGDIYKKKYSGLYCVGCESFKTESDLVDGKCPEHDRVPEVVEEENYFFRLSKYQAYLEEHLSKEGVVEPEWRRVEALNFVKKGLEDLSISREKSRLDWGVPVPGDGDQVMYVWFDALTNYISTLGWPEEGGNFNTFWKEGDTLQLAGKDQVRFQSIIWQAMLKSAGIQATDKIVYHGFINSDGKKMSKTIGNVISPYELVAKYGTDATRYLLLRHVHPVEDTDITWDRLDEWYTANMVNGIGNLVSRVMKMAEDHLTTPVTVTNEPLEEAFIAKLAAYRPDEALQLVFEHIGKGDAYIQETTPFKKIKSESEAEKEEARKIIEKLVRHIYRVAQHLAPFMPQTAEKIQVAVRENKKPENLFARLG